MNTTTLIRTDEALIMELLEEVIVAFNQMDLEKLLSLHTDDIILMEPDLPIVKGKRKIREMFADFRNAGIEMELDFKIDELEVSHSLAFVRGQVFKIIFHNGVRSEPEIGKFICLLKKQYDGAWLRTHVIVNRDHPLE